MENPFLDSVQNPVEYRVTWSGSKGVWRIYDTNTKESFEVPSISFIPLEVFNTVKGWHGKSDSGIYANEIKNTRTQKFNVRCAEGTICEGFWQEIKFEVQSKGGKWANVVYALLVGKKENKLATITFVGSSVGVWIDAKGKKGAHMYQCGKNSEQFKTPKGDIYYKPTIEMKPITEDQKNEAIEAYQPLHEFFKARNAKQEQSQVQDNEDANFAPLSEPVFDNSPQKPNKKVMASSDNEIYDLPF